MSLRPWSLRPRDEAALLGPSFLAMLIAKATAAYARESASPFPFALTFAVPPLVLHAETRAALPKQVRSSLPVWLRDNVALRAGFPVRLNRLVPYTREAVLFGMLHGTFALKADCVLLVDGALKEIDGHTALTDEVADCLKRSDFVGRWLARSGSAGTVLALFGVRT